MIERKFKNWFFETADTVVTLYIDKDGASANVLSTEVLNELNIVLDDIANLKPKALIIRSAKKSGFIAGADISEFTKLGTEEKAYELIKNGQSVFDKLEALPFTTITIIEGFCLGGGLELALATNYRIALKSSKVRLGLPETQLGIHPGFGGVVRLTHLIPTLSAMDLILAGKTVDTRKAKKLGMVDFVVDSRYLLKQADIIINKKPRKKKLSFVQKIPDKFFMRPIIKKILYKKLSEKALKENYPAPYKVIDLWAKHYPNKKTMMEAEAKSVASLITNKTAQNLIRLFFLKERLKSFGKGTDNHINHIHVIGAGTMGGDIAAWSVLKGYTVTLQDREDKFIAPAIKRAFKLFKRKLKEPHLIQNAMDRLIPDVEGRTGIHKADIVIEAIFEDLTVKGNLFKSIEPILKDGAVIATNTSSIPIDDLSNFLEQPERLIGIHFFNPVALMPLVEIVRGAKTSEETIGKAFSYSKSIDKLPLPVKSVPGFLVNRILMPYLLEAVTMVEEGIDKVKIDNAALNFGMPMGPIMLADVVGLDICLHVAEVVGSDLNLKIPQILKVLIDKGNLGKKSGQGFYSFKNGKSNIKFDNTKYDKEIADRLNFRLLNECLNCLKDNVVDDIDLLDAGIVFGTGFAPFRGGPINDLLSRDKDVMSSRAKELFNAYGESFKPSSYWDKI